jgi:hypothetical protein
MIKRSVVMAIVLFGATIAEEKTRQYGRLLPALYTVDRQLHFAQEGSAHLIFWGISCYLDQLTSGIADVVSR